MAESSGNLNPQSEPNGSNQSTDVHPMDKLDALWGILTNIFVVVALGLTINLVPRFWAGGPSVQSGLLTVIPAGLSILFTKEFLDSASPTKEQIKKLFKNCPIIPSFWYEEVLLGSSILFLVIATGATVLSPQIAECFYYKPAERKIKEKISDPQELSQAEANLKVAIALNPNYADAHFQLGWLYELRQDLGAAATEYKLAMQNGSIWGRIRLANLYLLDASKKGDEDAKSEEKEKAKSAGGEIDTKIQLNNADSAAIVLMQTYRKLQDLPDGKTLDKNVTLPSPTATTTAPSPTAATTVSPATTVSLAPTTTAPSPTAATTVSPATTAAPTAPSPTAAPTAPSPTAATIASPATTASLKLVSTDKYYSPDDCAKNRKIFPSSEDCDIVNNQLLKRSYYVALAWARIERDRYDEATSLMFWAFEQDKMLQDRFALDDKHSDDKNPDAKNKADPESGIELPPTIIYCVNAEFFDRRNKSDPSVVKEAELETKWAECRDSIGPIDPAQDPWLARAYKKLELLAKKTEGKV